MTPGAETLGGVLQLKEFLQQTGAAKKLTGLIKLLTEHPLHRVADTCKCVLSGPSASQIVCLHGSL